MLFDKENLFSKEQSLAVVQGTTLSEHSIDAGVAAAAAPAKFQAITLPGRDPGKGVPVPIFCVVTEEFDSAGDDTTLKIELVMADDEALTSNLVSIAESRTIPQSELVEGFEVPLMGGLPPGVTDQYLGMRYTTGTSTATAGKVTAGLRLHQQG